jgi:hypothetical protein
MWCQRPQVWEVHHPRGEDSQGKTSLFSDIVKLLISGRTSPRSSRKVAKKLSKLKVPDSCHFRNKVLREVRDLVYEEIVGENREPDEEKGSFPIRTDGKFLPIIFSVSR